MCVDMTQYPLVELDTGKKKVLLNYGVVIENRDFTCIDTYIMDWKLAILGKGKESFNRAVKDYGVKKILKYTGVPCGHCEECLKAKARGWAFRILKECEIHSENYFITLTYDDDHLPVSKCGLATLEHNSVISRFNKTLKNHLRSSGLDSTFKFYAIGEYGDLSNRPHYHIMYFGLSIYDLEFNGVKEGIPHFKSEYLSNIWKNGIVDIEMVHIGNACYISRYCDKKLDRSKKEKELIKKFGLVPEWSNMSRRPGLGSFFLDKIKENIGHDIFTLSISGNDFSIPIYYNKKLKDLLTDEELDKLEARNNLLIKSKFSRDFVLSDRVGNVQDYYFMEDDFIKSCKKLRDCL